VKTKSGSNERRETTIDDSGVFGELESRNAGLWLARGLPCAHIATLLEMQSNELGSKEIVTYAPGSSVFQQTAACAPHTASNLFPYSVVLENQTDTDVIAFSTNWGDVSMKSQGKAPPLFTRTLRRSNLTVIPAHRRTLFTPLGNWDPLDFVPGHGIDL
jgi:hypothetical protein